jgi:hypothetical protein
MSLGKSLGLGNWWKMIKVIILGHPIAPIISKFGQVL